MKLVPLLTSHAEMSRLKLEEVKADAKFLTAPTFHPEMSALKFFVRENEADKDSTFDTSQLERPLPSNASALRNNESKAVTDPVDHEPSSPLKALAPLNIAVSAVTLSMFQGKSWLNAVAP